VRIIHSPACLTGGKLQSDTKGGKYAHAAQVMEEEDIIME